LHGVWFFDDSTDTNIVNFNSCAIFYLTSSKHANMPVKTYGSAVQEVDATRVTIEVNEFKGINFHSGRLT